MSNDKTLETPTELIVEEPKKSVLTKIKEGAVKHSKKIKTTAKAAALITLGAVGYAVVTNLECKKSTLEIEAGDDFDGSDEETVVLEITEN